MKRIRDFGGVPSRAWRAGSRQKQGCSLMLSPSWGQVVVKCQRSARKNPLRSAQMCPGRYLPGPLKPVSRWCLARSLAVVVVVVVVEPTKIFSASPFRVRSEMERLTNLNVSIWSKLFVQQAQVVCFVWVHLGIQRKHHAARFSSSVTKRKKKGSSLCPEALEQAHLNWKAAEEER